MKRFKTLLIAFAVFTGTFAPVTATVSSFHVLPSVQKVHAQAVPAYDPEKAAENIQANLDCGVSWLGNGSLTGCLAWLVYAIPYTVGAYLLTNSAKILDITAAYTLSTTLFSASSFVADGWRLTRDISNMFFIFILLYIAISMVLGLDTGVNPKKMLISVVIIALMINFSMLITKVVIDTSNSLALLFYNQITVKSTVTGKEAEPDPAITAITAGTGVENKQVSESLAQGFNPHVFQSAEFFTNLKTASEPTVSQMKMIFVLLVVGSMFCVAAYAFFVSSLAFIGRLIMLMVSIVFAPLAFITYIIPSLKGKEGFGWSSWWSTLFSTAFAAPIYFFFILLISILAKSPMVSVTVAGDSMITLITLFISFMILITLLLKATSYAKKASGELGAKISGIGTSALTLAGGYALGAATGGVAMAGQQTIGRLGNRLATSETLKNASVSGGSGMMDRFKRSLAQSTINQGQKAATTSFNLPSTQLGKLIETKTGVKFSQPKNFGPMSGENLKGGYAATQKRKDEKAQKFAEALGYDRAKQAAYEKVVSARETEISTLTAKIAEIKTAAATLKRAEDSLLAAKASKNPAAITAAQNAVTAAKNAQPAGDALQLQQRVNDLTIGKKDAAGNLLKKEDIGKVINGKTVTLEDLGLNAQKQAAENIKKARMHQYLHNQMAKRGYEIQGTKTDAAGNITDVGHTANRIAARGWEASTRRGALRTVAGGAATGAIVGSAVPIVGTTIGAAVGATGGFLAGFRNAILPKPPTTTTPPLSTTTVNAQGNLTPMGAPQNAPTP